jgi:hypothetical protein
MLLRKPSKLAELRAKTDRELIALINHQIDSGLRWAHQLSEVDSDDDRFVSENIASQAERAYHEAAWLMHAVRDASLQTRLVELRYKLDDIYRQHPLETCSAGC